MSRGNHFWKLTRFIQNLHPIEWCRSHPYKMILTSSICIYGFQFRVSLFKIVPSYTNVTGLQKYSSFSASLTGNYEQCHFSTNQYYPPSQDSFLRAHKIQFYQIYTDSSSLLLHPPPVLEMTFNPHVGTDRSMSSKSY